MEHTSLSSIFENNGNKNQDQLFRVIFAVNEVVYNDIRDLCRSLCVECKKSSSFESFNLNPDHSYICGSCGISTIPFFKLHIRV